MLTPLALALHLVIAGALWSAEPADALAQAASRPAQSNPAAAGARQYQIPAGPLSAVLTRFSVDAGIYLVGISDEAGGKRSPGLNGNYRVQEGFAALLAGTGLEAFQRADGSYGLGPSSTPNSAPGGSLTTLAPVAVTAQGVGDASTEATGSYIAMGPSTMATRMAISQRETPQSISVVTRQQMDDFGLEDMTEVMLFTTGIGTATAAVGGGYQFTARGFNVNNVQVDGVQGSYREAGRGAFNPSVFDMALYDRVEVIRGATGLITGTGDPSATINLIRKRPGKEFAGSVSASIGSWNQHRLMADISTPITEDGRVRGRLISAYKEADAFRDYQSDQQKTVSGTIEIDLTPKTLLTFGHDFQGTDLRGEANTGLPLFDAAGNRTNLATSTSVAAPWTYWNKRYNNTFVYLDHTFDNQWKVKAAYSHQKNTGDVLVTGAGSGTILNANGSGISLLTNLMADGFRNQDNLDLNANGPFELFGRKHQLTLGANGTRSRDTSYTMQASSTAQYYIPNLYDWDGGMPRPTVSRTGASTRTTTEQAGLYGGARFSLADPLNLIIGARLSRYKTYRDDYNTAGRYLGTFAAQENQDELTPYAGITYDITPDMTAYASYTDLFKPQSYRDRNNNTLDPIVGSNVEVGLKTTMLQNRVNVNAAVFQTKQDNLAVLDGTVPPNSLPDGSQAYVSSGPGNKSRGFELEASGEVLRNWNLFASYSRSKTRDGTGQRINTYIPEQLVRIGTNYRFDGALQGLSVGATVNWQSRRELWTAGRAVTIPGVGTRTATHASYAVAGLHASYIFDRNWQASLNINNLFDKRYYDNFVSFRAQYGAPRNAQLTVRYQW